MKSSEIGNPAIYSPVGVPTAFFVDFFKLRQSILY